MPDFTLDRIIDSLRQRGGIFCVPFARASNPPGPDHPPCRRELPVRPFARLLGIVVGIAVFGFSALACWSVSFPAVPQPLRLQVVFPKGIAGGNEPLIATGAFASGDFLTIKYLDASTGTLSYDAWGVGGPSSAPFPLNPGSKRTLEIAMPSLADIHSSPSNDHLLRVAIDGREILRENVTSHGRQPEQIYFGSNPIGGTPALSFRGELLTPDSRQLHGGPAALLSTRNRLPWLLRYHGGELLVALFAGALLGYVTTRLASSSWFQHLRDRPSRPLTVNAARPPHRTFIALFLVCCALFVTLITGGTFRLIYEESFGSFFDHQAVSLLHGHLDVPESALSGEAFVVGGRYYGYFGVTPALLRLPLAAAHVAFGKLSRTYMLGYFAACLTAAYFLLCHATRVLGGPGKWPSRWAVVLLVGCTGLGSTLLFLGARAYVYHEAILCGATFALWSAYFTLRYADDPAKRWGIYAVIFGLLAVHARPPAGLFSLFLIGCASLHQMVVAWKAGTRSAARRHLTVGVLATIAMLSFNGMSYLKFGTFDGSPLRYSVQYTPERVAKFEGKNFHLANLRHNIDTYVLAADFRIEKHFPFVFFGSGHSPFYPEAKIDLAESTIAFPYAMAGLFSLALGGGIWALLWAEQMRRPILLLVIGVTPMALALFTAIVTSHRYTGDFCPFLIATAALGAATLDAESRRWRAAFLAGASVVGALSIVASILLAIEFQGEMVWGTQPEAVHNYQVLRARVDRLVNSPHR
jgi:hypothetical protein